MFNGSGSVSVEADEHVSPLIDIVEQLSKLNNINGAAHVLVEHADHHLAGLLAELGHVSINKCLVDKIINQLRWVSVLF